VLSVSVDLANVGDEEETTVSVVDGFSLVHPVNTNVKSERIMSIFIDKNEE